MSHRFFIISRWHVPMIFYILYFCLCILMEGFVFIFRIKNKTNVIHWHLTCRVKKCKFILVITKIYLFIPIKEPQFGQVCSCPWHESTQYGIAQHPSQQPQRQINPAIKWVLRTGVLLTCVVIKALQLGQLIDWGFRPTEAFWTMMVVPPVAAKSKNYFINFANGNSWI